MNIDAVINKTDLFDLVSKAGGEIDTRTGRCACPIHGGKDANAFHVYADNGKQYWKCFSGDCGGGDCIDFVKAWRGWDFKRAYEFLGGEDQSDPVEMKRLADERITRAQKELEEKQNRMEAARRELQVASRHILYHEGMKQWARDMWTARGIDEGMQDFWKLGSCDDFVINGDYHTPTLTIPIIGENMELLNIKHRLVNPPKKNDKYRPETSGLGAFPPLLAVPAMGYDSDLIVVVEGEIKAMVTWTRLPSIDNQVIGVAGKNAFTKISEKLSGKKVIIIPDPGGEKEAIDLAKLIHGSILRLPDKIDDYLVACGLGGDDFYNLLKQARRV
jgi:hypothetical protein